MSETHSKVVIKRTDGSKVTLTFKELLGENDAGIVTQVQNLERWVETLGFYRDTIKRQSEELVGLWDEYHTRTIRKAMDTCIEQINDAITRYGYALHDLELCVGAARAVEEWLAAHPDYNHHYRDNSGNDYYYCRKYNKPRSGKSHGPRYGYEPETLQFPSTS